MKKPSPAEAVKAGQQASQLPTGNVASVMERDILLQTPVGVEVHKVRQTPAGIKGCYPSGPPPPSAACTVSLCCTTGPLVAYASLKLLRY